MLTTYFSHDMRCTLNVSTLNHPMHLLNKSKTFDYMETQEGKEGPKRQEIANFPDTD